MASKLLDRQPSLQATTDPSRCPSSSTTGRKLFLVTMVDSPVALQSTRQPTCQICWAALSMSLTSRPLIKTKAQFNVLRKVSSQLRGTWPPLTRILILFRKHGRYDVQQPRNLRGERSLESLGGSARSWSNPGWEGSKWTSRTCLPSI
jgi:hypothetical protein